MKRFRRSVWGSFCLVAAANASATNAANYEGIWGDNWLGGYGTWLPLILVVIVYLIVWLARKHRK